MSKINRTLVELIKYIMEVEGIETDKELSDITGIKKPNISRDFKEKPKNICWADKYLEPLGWKIKFERPKPKEIIIKVINTDN